MQLFHLRINNAFSLVMIDEKENKMPNNLKWILLGIYLILTGLALLGVGLGGVVNLIAGICALIAGVLFLINR